MIELLIFTALCTWLYCATVGLKSTARGRKYKSGTGWCFWRWTDVTDNNYILRLHLLKTPWFAVCLHWIQKPDQEPWLHDHPVSFFSLILRGGYTELRKKGDGAPYHKVNRWFNFVRASDRDRHRIILARTNTLTLCFMGPKTREWGFHVWEEVEPTGWIMWKDYYARLRAGEDMRRLLSLSKFDQILKEIYTPERIERLAGLVRSEANTTIDVEHELDTAPADDFVAEEPSDPDPYGMNDCAPRRGEFLISREDFYKKVKL